MKNSGLIIQVLSLVVVGVLAFAAGFQMQEAKLGTMARMETQAQLQLKTAPPVEVATMTLEPRDWQETLVYTGLIRPWREAELAFAEGGIVTSLMTDKGHRVAGPDRGKSGQALARVDTDRLEALISSARASLAKAEWDLTQTRNLHKQGSASEEQVKELETLRDLRRAELTRADKSLVDATLRAPFSGIVADRMIELGEAASPQAPAFRLIQLSRVKVVVGIPGRRIKQVHLGQRADVQVDLASGEKRVLRGTVHYIPLAAKELLFPLEVALDNGDGFLREGMIATVRFYGANHPDTFVLPLETVIQEGSTRKVMLMEPEGEIIDGCYDLALLPKKERERVTALLPPTTGGWQKVTEQDWHKLEITAVNRLLARIGSPGEHKLLGRGVRVYHRGRRARARILKESRIQGNQCIIPGKGTFKAGELLIARGQYRVVDGSEVQLSPGNELSLPGGGEER